MVYYSLIYPFLIYCVQIWGLMYPTYLKSILITQKKIVRIITFSQHRAPSGPLFKSLSILIFLDVIKLQILSFIFQWIHHLTPANFNNYFQFASSLHPYSTRQVSNNNIYIKSVNSTQYGLHFIQITGPSLSNSLPANLKNCSSVATFHRKLKHYYIDTYCKCC